MILCCYNHSKKEIEKIAIETTLICLSRGHLKGECNSFSIESFQEINWMNCRRSILIWLQREHLNGERETFFGGLGNNAMSPNCIIFTRDMTQENSISSYLIRKYNRFTMKIHKITRECVGRVTCWEACQPIRTSVQAKSIDTNQNIALHTYCYRYLCYHYHNVPVVVSCALHQVLFHQGNLKRILDLTLYIIYRDRMYSFLSPYPGLYRL